jgi:CubicO group peptidase (beta-lactamase class C family)
MKFFTPSLIIASLVAFSPMAEAQSCEALARYNAERAGVSLVVMYRGEIICEDYPNGGAVDAGWQLASGTKSFSGIIAAAAVQDSLLELDEPVSLTLAEWADDPNLSQVTIAELLSLTSGASFPGYERPVRPPAYDVAVDVAVGAVPPGLQFTYGSGPFQVFGAVMMAKLEAAGLDRDPQAYLQRRVLDPLGIAPTRWTDRVGGLPHLPAGAAFTARDWARFGQFVLQHGHWEGEPLVDPGAFERLFEGSRANPAYGLTWWLAAEVDEQTRARIPQLRRATDITGLGEEAGPVWMAAGAGRQRLYVLPEAELVIVRQTDAVMAALRGRAPNWSDRDFMVQVNRAMGD